MHKVKKFIFCSSVGVFGTIPEKVPANLGNPLNGDNEYHYSKIIAEKASSAIHRYGSQCLYCKTDNNLRTG
jgi:nucleoside-diphosphate-sugar epimerase